jgi:hypothetical protein
MATSELTPTSIAVAHGHTFHGFMLAVKWFCIHLATILAFLVITFCTGAGFLWGVIAAVIVLGVGIWAMNHGLAHSTEQASLPH